MMFAEELRRKRAAKIEEGRGLLTPAREAGRNMTDEEVAKYDGLQTEIDNLDGQIQREERQMRLDEELRSGGPSAEGATKPDPEDHGQHEDRAQKPLPNPFKSFGEQMRAIVQAGSPGGTIDQRLIEVRNTASTSGGGLASTPSDGGWLIHPTFSEQIFQRAYDSGLVASRCDPMTLEDGSDSLNVPYIDETSRATGSRWGGVQVYRAKENDAVTAKKPKIANWKVEMVEMRGLAYATEKLLQNAATMGRVYQDAFANEFAFKLDDELISGSGAGECQGILGAACTVSIDKEANQAAATVVADNVMKMRSRLWGRSRSNAVWFVNQDVEPELMTMSVAVGTGGQLVWMPAGGISGAGYDRLLNQTIIPIEQASALGTVGDIILADMSQYGLVRRGGLQAASSMHVQFIYHEMTFRWRMEVNGKPKWAAALTPYKGTSNTKSPFVTLATRS